LIEITDTRRSQTVAKPKNPSTKPIDASTKFDPPPALSRPRLGTQKELGPDGKPQDGTDPLRIGELRGPDGGGKSTKPFRTVKGPQSKPEEDD
jgi:hypothetical protein